MLPINFQTVLALAHYFIKAGPEVLATLEKLLTQILAAPDSLPWLKSVVPERVLAWLRSILVAIQAVQIFRQDELPHLEEAVALLANAPVPDLPPSTDMPVGPFSRLPGPSPGLNRDSGR